MQFSDQALNIVPAVQSKAFLANRRGDQYLASAHTCLAAAPG
jgi:hypothetical protein